MSSGIPNSGESYTIPPASIGQYPNTNSSDSSENKIANLISRRHPEYNKKVNSWKFFGSTYEGGRQWFEDNIHKYYREGDGDYGDRVERSYRFNHTKEVVDLINKYLFKQNIQRSEDAPEAVKDFWRCATRGGSTVNEFAKQISKHCSIYGRIGIVVDRQRSSKEVLTVKEAKENKIRTYAYTVNPEDMLDYSFDDEGNLNWILIQETYRSDENPFDVDSIENKIRYRLWTRQAWYLISEKEKETGEENQKIAYQVVEQGVHDLGVVPVILADNFLSDEQYGAPSLINDIAYLDKAVANYLSNLDAIIQDQTFSQLTMPANNVMGGTDEHDQLVEMGTKRVFLYDAAGSSHAPEYIAPDPRQAHIILEVIARIIKEIYNSVGLSAERTNKDNAVSMDNTSGVAKAYDFERVNALLSAKADSLEIVEEKIVKLVCLWNDEKYDEEKKYVLYPDNFDTRGLYDEFDIAARLALVDAPDKMRQEQMKTMSEKLFPMIKEKLRKEIEAEIEKWPASKEEQMMQMSAPNNPNYQKTGGKGDATSKADATASGNKKKPEANNRQGQVTKNTK